MPKSTPDPLIPKHGGYRNLKSFQVAQLVYDVTVRFCDRYIDKRSRTHDQMVQAARSGVQNIAEGSQASTDGIQAIATSKKMEMKLTNVARASLEELRLDYEDFLRQRGLEQWPPDHPTLMRFKSRRYKSVEEISRWVETERRLWVSGTGMDAHGQTLSQSSEASMSVPESPKPPSSAQIVANIALSLLNIGCYLLDRQLEAQAKAFEQEGGFTERLYRTRQQRRKGP
jgi:four helix bundle suffix protein